MKTEFVRTPESTQTIIDYNLEARNYFKIPVFASTPSIGDNANTDGAIALNQALGVMVYRSGAWEPIANGYEPEITPGAITDLWSGDKTWKTVFDGAGKIITSLLPSYVDDILEVTTYSALPVTGESGKIYVTTDTNRTYRWTGSIYVQIVASPGTTDEIAEGTTNLYYTDARVQTFSDARYYTKTASDAKYSLIAGSSSITTVGVIGAGTWQGSAIADTYIASSSFWNTAYSWGNHAGLYSPIAGSTSLITLGTVTSGVWNGTAIADTYISSASTWNAKQAALSGTGLVKSSSGTISYITDNSSNWNTAFGWGNHAGLYPTYNGTGATGTWGISVSGNAATWGAQSYSNGIAVTQQYAFVYDSSNSTWRAQTSSGFFAWMKGDSDAVYQPIGSYLTGNQTITLSGDVSGSGTTAITTTIGAAKITNAMLAGSIDLTTKVTGLLPNANINSVAWSKITSTPTTIVGYGITDYNSLGDARWVSLSGSYSNPSWITAIANSKITGLGSYALRSSGLAELSGATFTGAVSVTNSFTNRAYTGGGYSAFYASAVTEGNTNYSLISNGANTDLNATTQSALSVNDTRILRAISTGVIVTGDVAATTFTGSAAGLTSFPTLNQNTTGSSATVTSIGNLTGDITSVNRATTLATVNSNVGSFGSSTAIPTITVNAKGLVTALTTNAVVAPAGTLTGTTLASNVVGSSLTSAAGGSFGTYAYRSSGLAELSGNNSFNGNNLFANASTTVGQIRIQNTLTGGKTWELQSYTDGSLYIANQAQQPVLELKDNRDAAFYGNLSVTGTGDFSGTVSGATPTLSTHLVTKGYGDANYAPIGTSASYSEGTWTPSVTTGSSSVFGRYTKIGNMVYAYFKFSASASGSGSPFELSGLPFTASSNSFGAVIISNQNVQTTFLTGYVSPSSTVVYFQNQTTILTDANLGGKSVTGMLIYSTTN